MPPKLIDLTGQQFGKWIVIGPASQKYHWYCQCDCGEKSEVAGRNLRKKSSIQCKRCAKKTHGMRYIPEYQVWRSMKKRCFNPKHESYKNYGGRGIVVCEEWKNSFETFYRDMGPRPPGLTIERVDNNRGYYKENCKWATYKEQANNKRAANGYKIRNTP